MSMLIHPSLGSWLAKEAWAREMNWLEGAREQSDRCCHSIRALVSPAEAPATSRSARGQAPGGPKRAVP